MWVMLTNGALSITVSPKEPNKLQVRARRREWLESFREHCPELGPAIHTPQADYQWRALAVPEHVAAAMQKITMEITYSNFKNATGSPEHGLAGPELRWGLHDAYAQIWAVLLRAGDGTSSYNRPQARPRGH